ncbi:uncharacterized protein [Onthophagus taurus]|uniref:uncharacterized protein n=1 Tax=Onthophagus taurus TaxID=166361 RepID=UPI000C1FEDE3|nr:uncharacterized protein LOC111418999 [Onthophagus taurus]
MRPPKSRLDAFFKCRRAEEVTSSTLVLMALFLFTLRIGFTQADCWYNGGYEGNRSYGEGEEVMTAEPCLNCTCSRSTLLCYLRVCPKLPNPPPPGCILLYRYKTCCPDLICHDSQKLEYNPLARSEEDGFEIESEHLAYFANACVANGTIYAPGSAMDSSSYCEYCYCLAGKQRCVKPKCLLPIDGCSPMYHSSSCCPVHYKCENTETTTSTTTQPPKILENSCLVSGTYHPNGHKILGVGHSACDNCYCIKGLVRCEPLSCAPPLLGCSPVIRPGECCAASYNCSGTIEARPEVNYDNIPIMSKEYAKLRKEATTRRDTNHIFQYENVATAKPQRTSGYFGTTRHFSGNIIDTSTVKPQLNPIEDMIKLNDVTTKIYPEIVYRPNNKYHKIDSIPVNHVHINSILNGNLKLNPAETFELNKVKETTTTEIPTTETADLVTTDQNHTEATEIGDATMLASTIFDLFTQELFNDDENDIKKDDDTSIVSTEFPTTLYSETIFNSEVTTIKSVLNSTDCIENSDQQSDESSNHSNLHLDHKEDVTTVDLESKVKVSTVTMHPLEKLSVDALVLTKDKDDYDYGKPTLPPSLPNLKIIPFLPSDAVDTKTEIVYPPFEDRTDTLFAYALNSFTPPNKTESGFVPKDPPPIEDYYDPYTSGLDGNAVTAITKAITPLPLRSKLSGVSCLHELNEYRHGETIPSNNICEVCECFFGNVICHEYNCPPLKPGCRESGILERTTCCPHIICDDESIPSSLLEQIEDTSSPKEVVTVAEGIISQNPFKDVIRTEPAPNLNILRDDMKNFIQRKSQTTTPFPITSKNDEYSLDKIFQSLLSDSESIITTSKPEFVKISTTISTTNQPINEEKVKTGENYVKPSESPGVGLLKLAGCNIYGRMYRVGRIISELSGPCLECKCTEVGVQCKDLC